MKNIEKRTRQDYDLRAPLYKKLDLNVYASPVVCNKLPDSVCDEESV